MNEVTLARRVTDAICTAWAVSPDWTYQVIVQFVPVEFWTEGDASLRQYESVNSLEEKSVLKVEWIKPVQDRKPLQKVVTTWFYHRDAKPANVILSRGAHVLGKKVIPKKLKRGPIWCLKCQQFGHERRNCMAATARCVKCACAHETEECQATRRVFECVNCGCNHPSYDRFCQSFLDKCIQLNICCPKNNLAFYPTEEPWSWVTMDQTTPHKLRDDSQGPQWFDQQLAYPTAANSVPLGQYQHHTQQHQPPHPPQ